MRNAAGKENIPAEGGLLQELSGLPVNPKLVRCLWRANQI
jgi:hypothetical protein